MTCYVGDAELICECCAEDMSDDQIAIGGEADSPSHCGICHRPLFDDFGFTAECVNYVLDKVRAALKTGTSDNGWRWQSGYYEGLGKPACLRDWSEHVLDNCFRLPQRDKRTLELYLHFTQWAQP